MTFHTTTRRPLFRVPNRRPLLISVASAAFGAAATVAVIAGWSAFGPGHAANAAGQTTSASALSLRSYPASREGVRGPVDTDASLVNALPIGRQTNYPASREGVRGPVDTDSSFVAAVSASTLPNFPASREGVRGPVDTDSSFVVAVSASTLPSYPASREGGRGPVSVD